MTQSPPTTPQADILKSGCNEAFEKWVKDHNQAEIKWLGHSYANAYMAAQWEGFQAAYYLAQPRAVEKVEPLLGLEEAIAEAERWKNSNHQELEIILKAARIVAAQQKKAGS